MKKTIATKSNKKTKTFFFLSPFCLLLFSLLPFSVFAQGGITGPLTWNLENDTLTISGRGKMPDYTSPPYCSAPWYNYSITTIIIENGVTSISRFAFVHCFILSSVSISNTVTEIGSCAFAECLSLTSFILPNSVVRIEESAFARCNALTTITNLNPIPVTINPNVFYNINISACTLKVPIASVSAYKKAEVWKEFNIVGIEAGITDPDPKTGSGDQLVLYPNPSTGTCNITIPEEFLFESSLILSIYDNSGKLLQQIPIENEAESFNVQLEHRAAGVYPVVLSNGRKSYRGKIVFK